MASKFEEIGEKVGSFLGDARNAAKKGAKVIGDAGKVAVDFAGEQVQRAKETFEAVGKEFDETKTRKALEKYKPIFPSEIEARKAAFPKVINIVETDKRLNYNECKGSVGFFDRVNDVDLMGVYLKDIGDYNNITFYPTAAETLYYVDPFDSSKYIEISSYFQYLKTKKIDELCDIAQALGAKHLYVRIFEESSSKEKSEAKAGGKVGLGKEKAQVGAERSFGRKNYDCIEIAVDTEFPGKEPSQPELKYWANEDSIRSLINQRINTNNPIKSKSFTLKYNTSSGIKEKEAAKIDGVLKGLKVGASASIKKEAESENRKLFEYEIEF